MARRTTFRRNLPALRQLVKKIVTAQDFDDSQRDVQDTWSKVKRGNHYVSWRLEVRTLPINARARPFKVQKGSNSRRLWRRENGRLTRNHSAEQGQVLDTPIEQASDDGSVAPNRDEPQKQSSDLGDGRSGPPPPEESTTGSMQEHVGAEGSLQTGEETVVEDSAAEDIQPSPSDGQPQEPSPPVLSQSGAGIPLNAGADLDSLFGEDQAIDRQRLGPIGFRNPDQRCFRSAVLQCLFHLPQYVQVLAELGGDQERASTEVSEKASAESTEDKARKTVKVFHTLKALGTAYWETRDGQLEECVDRFHQATVDWCEKDSPYKKLNEQGDAADYLLTVIQTCLQHQAHNEFAIRRFEDLFISKFRLFWRCDQCREFIDANETDNREEMVTLPISKDQDKTLVHLLHANNTLQTQSARCKSQPCRQAAEKEGQDQVPPIAEREMTKLYSKSSEILFVSINRTSYEIVEGIFEVIKIDHAVDFDDTLNFARYMKDGSEVQYRLCGVVSHTGEDNKGHYIAAVRNYGKESWSLLDDDKPVVNPYKGSLAALQSDGMVFTVTLLMYEKVHATNASDVMS